ncbi:hypothetical protein F5Y06DRAFT_221591 [Hypoxylon sp. FL0890]|nr:hypothetical protein F5Y06DRAFT_221591 [Hypoxylon sp. FL0890]
MAENEEAVDTAPDSLVGSDTAVKSEAQDGQDLALCQQEGGLKRPLPSDTSGDNVNHKRNKGEHSSKEEEKENGEIDAEIDVQTDAPTLSKNQLRKLKRQKIWEEKKKAKKEERKKKRHDKKERKQLEREAEIAAATIEGREPILQEKPQREPAIKVPVTIIIDCQYEKYMMEKELVSLGNQVTRCYSDNRNAKHPVHMFISSYGGQMKERNETVLKNQHENWKNIRFVEGDFVEAAAQAKTLMNETGEDQLIDVLVQGKEGDSISLSKPSEDSKKKQKTALAPEPEADDVDKSIVYLTADSPYTIDRLEPNTCYVIGGLIDKNREKGLCYKIARQRNVRTAKLPIGDFMVMTSRHVLATNHVMEIMLHWLETGDWRAAFMKAIPQRKGGKLKEDTSTPEVGEEKQEEATRDTQPENDAVAAKDIEMNSLEIDGQGGSTAQAV